MILLNFWKYLQIDEHHDVTSFIQYINNIIKDLKYINLK